MRRGRMVLLVVAWLALYVGAVAVAVTAQEKIALEPQFTREQSLQLENFTLRDQTLQTQMVLLEQAAQKNTEASQKNRTDREAYIQAMEKAFPGWLINRKTDKWERAPTPAPAQKK